MDLHIIKRGRDWLRLAMIKELKGYRIPQNTLDHVHKAAHFISDMQYFCDQYL